MSLYNGYFAEGFGLDPKGTREKKNKTKKDSKTKRPDKNTKPGKVFVEAVETTEEILQILEKRKGKIDGPARGECDIEGDDCHDNQRFKYDSGRIVTSVNGVFSFWEKTAVRITVQGVWSGCAMDASVWMTAEAGFGHDIRWSTVLDRTYVKKKHDKCECYIKCKDVSIIYYIDYWNGSHSKIFHLTICTDGQVNGVMQ